MRKFITDILAKTNLGVEQNAYVLGTVGIGTSSPISKLDIRGSHTGGYGVVNIVSTDSAFISIDSQASDGGLRLKYNTEDRWLIGIRGNDKLQFNNASDQPRIVVQQNGNVGIGTSNPTYALDVYNTGAGAARIRITGTSNYSLFQSDNSSGNFYLGIDNSAGNGFGQGAYSRVLYSSGAYPLVISTNDAERMRITSAGNVGIGTTSPLSLVHASNGNYRVSNETSSTFRGYVFGATAGDSTEYSYLKWEPQGGELRLWNNPAAFGGFFSIYTNASERMRITSSGNVGIGTTSPAYTLDVSGTARTTTGTYLGTSSGNVIVGGTTSDLIGGFKFIAIGNTAIQYAASTGTYLRIEPGAADTEVALKADARSGAYPPMAFYTSNTERLRITDAGNVGIGTTSPTQKLSVQGNTDLGNSLGSTTSSTYTTRISGYAMRYDASNRYGNYGVLILNADSGWTASARKFMLTSGLNVNKFAIIRSVDSTTDPAFGDGGSISSGTADFVIDSNGLVGIGTTTPTAKLDVNGAQIIQSVAGFGTDGDQAALFLSNAANFGLSGNFSGYSRNLIKSDGGSLLTVGRWNTSLIGELSIESGSSGLIKFLAGASERMRITSGGNVGIGTTSPSAKLHVTGELKLTDAAAAYTFFDQINGTYYSVWYRNNNITYLYDSYLNSTPFVVNSSGNVGIGTTSPTAPLTFGKAVYGDPSYEDFYRIKFQDVGGVNNDIGIGQPASGSLGFNVAAFGYISFNEGTNGERVRIAAGGNVGIGTTSPTLGLHIADGKGLLVGPSGASGSMYVSPSDENTINGSYGIASDTADIWLNYRGYQDGFSYFRDTRIGNGKGTAILMVDGSEGNVGIGTTNPTEKLDVRGNFLLKGDATDGGILTITRRYSTGAQTINFNNNHPTTNLDWTGARITSADAGNYNGYLDFAVSLGSNGSEAAGTAAVASVMRLTKDGNVGIGTTSPSSTYGKLTVAGGISTTDDTSSKLQLGRYSAGIPYSYIKMGTNSNGLRITNPADNEDLFTITSGGNVGIGTNSPNDLLTLQRNDGRLRFNTSAGTRVLYLGDDFGSGGFQQIYDSTGAVKVQFSAGVSYFNGGSVGIGTNNPGAKLEVDGSFNIKNGDGNITHFNYVDGSTNYVRGTTYFDTAPVYFTGGSVGIGTTSPVAALHVQSSSTKLFLSNTDFVANTTGSGMILHTGASSGNTYSQIYAFQSGNTVYANLVIPGGNVGIGTSSPDNKLHILGAAGLLVKIAASGGQIGGLYADSTQVALTENGGSSAYAIYPSSNVLSLSTNATERMRITSGGNVGIGTTSPNQKLSVEGGNIQLNANNAAANYYLFLNKKSGQDGGILFNRDNANDWQLTNGAGNGDLVFYSYGTSTEAITFKRNTGNVGIGTTSPLAKLQVSSGRSYFFSGDNYSVGLAQTAAQGNYMYLGTATDGTFYISETTGTARVTVQQGGNVGIGTTSPEQKLHVEGTIQLGNTENLAWAYDNGSYYNYITNTYDTSTGMTFRAGSWTSGNNVDFSFQTYYGGSWSTKLAIKGDGNVGIGTTSPLSPLHQVAGGGNYTGEARFGGSSTAFGIELKYTQAGSTLGSIYTSPTYSSADILFKLGAGSGNENQLVLKGNGNVGIGTSSPSYKLDVNGVTRFQDIVRFKTNAWNLSDDGYDRFYFSPNGRTYFGSRGGYEWRSAADTTLAVITDAGNVGIGTTSPASALHVNGTITVGATVSSFVYGTLAYVGSTDGVALSAPGQNMTLTTGYNEKLFIKSGQGGLQFQTNDGVGNYTDRLLINQTRSYFNTNVGIGTTSPLKRLHVAQDLTYSASQSGQLYVGGETDTNKRLMLGYDTTNNFAFIEGVNFGAAYSNVCINPAYGNVGIGTTSPSYKLHVDGGASGIPLFVKGGTSGWSIFERNNKQLYINANYSDLNLYAQVSPAAVSNMGLSLSAREIVQDLYLTTSGNIGIGTTSPTQALTIQKSGYPIIDFYDGATGRGDIGYNAGTTSFNIGAYGAIPMVFYVNSTERMRITSAGNVGIGTTSPSYKLDVNGTARVQSGLYVDENSVGAGSILRFIGGSSYYNFQIAKQYTVDGGLEITPSTAVGGSTYSTPALVVKANGNVGIGTTAPAAKLHVSSGYTLVNNAYSFAVNNSAGSAFAAQFGAAADVGFVSTGNNAIITAAGANAILLGTNNTERMRITSAGNVGIGTTNPAYKLDVFGIDDTTPEIRIGNSSGKTAFIGFSSTYGFDVDAGGAGGNYLNLKGGANGSTGGITFSTFALERMRIDYTGNVGIGTTSPNRTLSVNGIVGISSGTANTQQLVLSVDSGASYITSSYFGSSSYVPMYLETGGNVRLAILTNGNIGIGTTSPAYKLDVSGVGRLLSVGIIQASSNSDTPNIAFTNNGTSFTWGTIGGLLQGDGDGALFFNTKIGGSVTEKMRITSAGNVGIGTTSPTGELHIYGSQPAFRIQSSVSGNMQFGQWDTVTNRIQSTGRNFYLVGTDSYDTIFATNGSERMRITSGGNVGIGTTSPAAKLDIVGSDGFRTSSDQSTSAFVGIVGTASEGRITVSSYGSFQPMTFYTGGSERMRITSGGNVGIGTSSPTYILDTYGGEVRFKGSSTYMTVNIDNNSTSGGGGIYLRQNGTIGAGIGLSGWYLGGTSSDLFLNSESGRNIRFAVNAGTEAMRITSGGNVGIGTTSPSYKLHVEGNVSGISIYASHDIAAFSDITVKKDVERIENAVDKVKELNGYTYVRTDDETGTRRAGVIAQEVQKVLPEVVSANPDGTLNVAYANMVALLIEAVKEQQKEIDELKRMLNK